MNRRGFLSGFGVAGAIGMAAPALAMAKASPQGFTWATVCPNSSCREPLSQYIDMSGPLKVGNQCPKCLYVLDTSPLADQIREFNGQDKYGRPLSKRFMRDLSGKLVELP